MCQSWMHSPEDRPSFTDVAARLHKRLDDKATEVIYVQFKILFRLRVITVKISSFKMLEQFSSRRYFNVSKPQLMKIFWNTSKLMVKKIIQLKRLGIA